MSALTLPVDTLRRAVLSVAPAAAKRNAGTAPVLEAVRLVAADGGLTLAATDRFSLHVVEVDLPECSAGAELDVQPQAEALLRAVKAVKPPKTAGTAVALARLAVSGRLLTVEHGVGSLDAGLPDEYVDGIASVPTVEGTFPRFETLFPSVPVPSPTALTGVSPTLLARACTAAAQVLDRGQPVRLWTAPALVEDDVTLPERGATRPMLLTATVDEGALRWRALLMPVRLPTEAAS